MPVRERACMDWCGCRVYINMDRVHLCAGCCLQASERRAHNALRWPCCCAAGGLSVVQEVDVGDASLTHVIPPGSSGRLLFAADEEGSVRAYKFPLTQEHQSQRWGWLLLLLLLSASSPWPVI